MGSILNLTAYTPGIPVHAHAAYPDEINLHATPIGHHDRSTLPNQNTFSDHNIHYSDAASAGIEGLHGNFSLNDTNGIPHFTSSLADFPGVGDLASLAAVPDPPLMINPPLMIDPSLMTDPPLMVSPFSLVGRNSRTRRTTAQFYCPFPGCSVTFTRKGDLRRHRLNQHRAPQHDCPVNGCDRKGAQGFRRNDKLIDHQRKKHKMAI